MNEFEQQKQNLFQLVESWATSNLEVALQLSKGSRKLLKALRERYLPVLRLIGRRQLRFLHDLADERLSIHIDEQRTLAYREDLKPVLASLPCRYLSCYTHNVDVLPWWVCELQQLEHLHINGGLGGKAPWPSAIGQLKQLKELNIIWTDLHKLPDNINEWSSLTYIHIKESNLTKLPQAIGELTALSDLKIEKSKLQTLPQSIGQLTNLNELNLEHNQLKALPDTIGNMSQLKRLQLDHNRIKEIPNTIGNLKALEWLCLEGNKISKLPKTIGGLENISWLSIEGTPLGKKMKVTRGHFISQESELIQKIIAIAD